MTALLGSWRAMVAACVAGSAAVLAAALFAQHVAGLAPCVLCILQRWPHAAAVAFGVLALALPGMLSRLAMIGAALSLLIGVGIAGYHVGVEQHWWAGPDACSITTDIGSMTPEQLLRQLSAAPVVPCDEVAWSVFGISMAGWNALASIALAALFGHAVLTARACAP